MRFSQADVNLMVSAVNAGLNHGLATPTTREQDCLWFLVAVGDSHSVRRCKTNERQVEFDLRGYC